MIAVQKCCAVSCQLDWITHVFIRPLDAVVRSCSQNKTPAPTAAAPKETKDGESKDEKDGKTAETKDAKESKEKEKEVCSVMCLVDCFLRVAFCVVLTRVDFENFFGRPRRTKTRTRRWISMRSCAAALSTRPSSCCGCIRGSRPCPSPCPQLAPAREELQRNLFSCLCRVCVMILP